MKIIIAITLFSFMQFSHAKEFTVSEEVMLPNTVFSGGYQPHVALGSLIHKSMEQCPHGFEQKRIWLTNTDDAAMYHMTIDCFDAQTTPSKP